jgi:two-component system phosphate regulon response regulator PhoB
MPLDKTPCSGAIALDVAGIGGSSPNTLSTGPIEYRVSEFCLRNPVRIFARDQITDRVWSRGAYREDCIIDLHILRLRKLLKPFE